VIPEPHLDYVVIPCRDLDRQRVFYERILGRAPDVVHAEWVRYALGHVYLALRARGDALFPREPAGGVQLSFRLETQDELERWHRRLLTARVAVLEPPDIRPWGHRSLCVADPEGNVVTLFVDLQG